MNRIHFSALLFHILLVTFVIHHLTKHIQFYSNVSTNTTNNVKGVVSHISVSALIGFRGLQEIQSLTLFGYSSPNALVVLENNLFPQSTHAESSGYFELVDASIPINQKEVCISSYDSFGRLSTPTCFPLSDYSIDKDQRIGPILLAPTISADKGTYYIGDESIVSGQTIPNANVYFSIYQNTNTHLSLVPETYAYFLPELTTRSDKKGNYSISFPTNHSSDYRLFIRTEYNNNFTPKSNTLFLRVYPLWMYVIAFLRFLFSSFSRSLIELILLMETLLFILILIRRYFNPYQISRSRTMMIYKPLLPTKSSILPAKQQSILPTIER